MKILVTGAAGFVGRALCGRLVADGHQVVGVTRHATDLANGVRNVAMGDLGRVVDWPALDGCDAVVHLAAHVHRMRVAADDRARFREVNVDATGRLAAEALRRGVNRFVFLSTVKVHGESTGESPVRESDPIAPVDDYSRSKAEAEVVVRQSGLPNVTLRPPLVYGPGVGANFLALLRAVARGRPLPLGCVENRRSLVYVGNLVDAIVAGLSPKAVSGSVFLVSDGDAMSSAELVRRMAAALGVRARLLSVPVPALKALAAVAGRSGAVRRLTGSLEVDDSLLRRTLGWVPPCSVDEGLRRTAEWYRAEVAR